MTKNAKHCLRGGFVVSKLLGYNKAFKVQVICQFRISEGRGRWCGIGRVLFFAKESRWDWK